MEKAKGIVLKVIDYKDNSKIIYIMTRNGLKSLIVKGANKVTSHTFNFAKDLILLELEADLKEKYLIGGKVLSYYQNIKDNYDSLKTAYTILELVYNLANHINDYSIAYCFLEKTLDSLNNKENAKFIELIFRIKFLYLIGLAPNFNSCVECGKKEEICTFSLFDGGVKCKSCYSTLDYNLSIEEASLFKTFYLVKFETLLENKKVIKYNYESLSNILDMFYSHFLGFNSKVKKVYKKI